MCGSDSMPAVIMAGGKGTRISPVDASVPKPMLKIAGKPMLEYQIECLARQELTDITLVIGHLGHIIADYFGDGSRWGVNIRYFSEDQPLGTAGALRHLTITKDFLLTNGDLLFNVDLSEFRIAHLKNNALATIFTHPNDHPYDSELVVTDDAGKVMDWLHKDHERIWYQNRVNAGLHILSPKAIQFLPEAGMINLDRDLLKPLIQTGRVYSYSTPEFVMDVGTPERLKKAEKAVRDGRLALRGQKNRAVFLDRDGTINRENGFLNRIDDFELLEGAAEGIRLLNQMGYLVIVVTNQPVIARGELSWDGLKQIHNKMETLLGREGAYIDDIVVCPHHPEKGFQGERPEYKIDCDCRKPKPGMLLQAAEKYAVDLAQSWMVGDHNRDMQAGIQAGCKTAILGKDQNQAFCFDGLLEFAVFLRGIHT